MKTELLQFRNVSVIEDSKQKLSGLTFQVFSGEIVGLTGLNDTGKGAFIRLMLGESKLSQGSILLENNRYVAHSIADSRRRGVYNITKQSTMVNALSVEDNLCVIDGNVPLMQLTIKKERRRRFREILEKYSLSEYANCNVYSLLPAEKYLLEIVKAMMNGAKLIILSDIFYVFSHEKYSEKLCDLCTALKNEGISLIIIGNRYNKVLSMANRIIVLNKGRVARTLYQDEFDRKEFDNYLFGSVDYNKIKFAPIKSFSKSREWFVLDRVRPFAQGGEIRISAHKNEILGIYDSFIAANVYNQLLYENDSSARVFLDGKRIRNKFYYDLFKSEISLFPQQVEEVMFSEMSSIENLETLCLQRASGFMGMLNTRILDYLQNENRKRLMGHKINPQIPLYQLRYRERFLVMIERFKLVDWKVMFFLNPSLNYDPIETQLIYNYIYELKSKGCTVILFSSDMSELRGLCERILVLNEDMSFRTLTP